MLGRVVASGSLALLMLAGAARAGEKEPAAIVEIGGAGEWSFTDRVGRLGPTVAVEVTPIPEWLEIETGVTSLFGRGGTEWSADLLFKKPFTLSDKVEFMVGAGPEWNLRTGSVAAEVALESGKTVGWVERSETHHFTETHG